VKARGFATETLADYASEQPDVLFKLLAEAEHFQFPFVFDKLARHKDEAIALGTAELARKPSQKATDEEKDFLAKRQAKTAVALYRLGSPDRVWPTLKFSPDPTVRSYVIDWLSPLGGDPQPIIQRFDIEPDVTIRRALLLTLGEFTEVQLPVVQRQPSVEKLLDVYENEPDAGLHSAVEWLLRKWGHGKRLETLVERFKSDEKQLQSREGSDKRQWYVNTQKQTFVVVDAREGWFWMGSPVSEPGHSHEGGAPHRVRIGRRFAIATTEITKDQFGRFQQARPKIARVDNAQWVKTEDSSQVDLRWYEAAAYCDWLSEQEQIDRNQWCYDPKGGLYGPGMKLKDKFWELTGYRLATEAEWEFACRAATATSRYFGLTQSLLPRYAWYQPNSRDHTWPVGRLKPNDLGLFDMLGSVNEWCFDPNDSYPQADRVFDDMPSTRPVETTDRRVLRGGSLNSPALHVRSADRISLPPVVRDVDIGFRPARTYP
jgi:eukaryotic-like serine/threonine-protein kinase